MTFFNISNLSLLLVGLFVLTRLLFLEYPFWGLEYEDSFIYNDTGRFLSFKYDYDSMPFLCQSCLDGNYIYCNQYGSYGGHFLTLPILLNFINLIFGYNYSNIFIFNFTFSIFTILFAITNWNKFTSLFSLNLFLIILLVTPFYSLFNTSGLSETVSGFFVFCFLLSIYKTDESGYKIKSLNYWLTIAFLFLAVLTKRENIILLSLVYLIPLIRYLFKQKLFCKSYLILTAISSLIIAGLVVIINPFNIESNESVDIGKNTFEFNYLVTNLQQFLYAIANFKIWGLTGFFFIFSITFVIYKRKISKLGLMCFMLTFSFLILYSSHYRSYYQVVYNLANPFETLRYSVNYFPILALFISTLDLKLNVKNFRNIFLRNFIMFSIILVILFLVLNVIYTRINYSREEIITRIEPVKKLLSIVSVNDVIITDIPIIFHCYANEKQDVVDMYSLTDKRFQEIINTKQSDFIYYLRPNDLLLNVQRYGIKFETSCFKDLFLITKNYDLLKYSKQ